MSSRIRRMPNTNHDDVETRGSERDQLHFALRKVQRHPAFLATKDSLRFARQLVPNIWRLATYRRRALPSIVIVGAQKAGTTQLYANLVRHPQLFGGTRKELHYFSKHSRWPRAWYQSRFPLQSHLDSVSGICLEASPSYMPSAKAIRRMHVLLPNSLVIAVLRDPVARAFSHYQHEKTRRRETRSFPIAVDESLQQNSRFTPEFGGATSAGDQPLTNYVARGYYALQLESIFEFYPRERVVIIDSADLFADTNAVCQAIFKRIGLDPIEIRSEKIYNRGYYRETIDPVAAQRLREHYLPYDELLCELLGRRFGWMNTIESVPQHPISLQSDRQAA